MAFHASDAGAWATVHGKHQGAEVGAVTDPCSSKAMRSLEKEGIVVSPSRFSPLLGIDEEDEDRMN